MTGNVQIFDGTTGGSLKVTFTTVTNFLTDVNRAIEQTPADGDPDLIIDDLATNTIKLIVGFDLLDTVGSTKWQKKESVLNLRDQPVNDFYTLLEEDDTQKTSGWQGVVKTITINRAVASQSKLTGTLIFLASDDVFIFEA